MKEVFFCGLLSFPLVFFSAHLARPFVSAIAHSVHHYSSPSRLQLHLMFLLLLLLLLFRLMNGRVCCRCLWRGGQGRGRGGVGMVGGPCKTAILRRNFLLGSCIWNRALFDQKISEIKIGSNINWNKSGRVATIWIVIARRRAETFFQNCKIINGIHIFNSY